MIAEKLYVCLVPKNWYNRHQHRQMRNKDTNMLLSCLPDLTTYNFLPNISHHSVPFIANLKWNYKQALALEALR